MSARLLDPESKARREAVPQASAVRTPEPALEPAASRPMPGLRPRMLRRARHVELCLWALALAVACAAFVGWPALDLRFSALFVSHDQAFVGAQQAWVHALYVLVPWATRASTVGLVLVLTLRQLRMLRLRPGQVRRMSALLFAFVVGTGLVVNLALKDHWGRPRPHQVQEFGGAQAFVPALVASNLCSRNCSFVSGHAASGFALIAVGAFAATARRRYWLGVGLATGSMLGLARVMQGSHFASDIVFSALVMWGCTLVMRWAWLRWRVRRLRRRGGAPGPLLRKRRAAPKFP